MFIKHKDFILRKLVVSDAANLFRNYKGDFDCAKYITSNPHTGVEQTRKLINTCLSDYQINNPTSLKIAIAEPINNEVIGLLVLVFNKEYAEIHFGLASNFSGRGIATSVCLEGITWLQNRGIMSIRTKPYSEHHASLRVLEKCGFTNHGVLEKFCRFPLLDKDMRNCMDMRIDFQ